MEQAHGNLYTVLVVDWLGVLSLCILSMHKSRVTCYHSSSTHILNRCAHMFTSGGGIKCHVMSLQEKRFLNETRVCGIFTKLEMWFKQRQSLSYVQLVHHFDLNWLFLSYKGFCHYIWHRDSWLYLRSVVMWWSLNVSFDQNFDLFNTLIYDQIPTKLMTIPIIIPLLCLELQWHWHQHVSVTVSVLACWHLRVGEAWLYTRL